MYRHILVALDLSSESRQVLARALQLQSDPKPRISLMHVIEPIAYAYGGDIPVDMTEVTENLREQAENQLTELCTKHRIENANTLVRMGRAATELHAYADDQGVDLIVVGSHGRSGLQLLLGSTANSVLHGAACDVLAVRIQES